MYVYICMCNLYIYRYITFNEKTLFLSLSDNLNVLLHVAAANRIGNDEKCVPVKLCFILEN